jgi:hypothetical protein
VLVTKYWEERLSGAKVLPSHGFQVYKGSGLNSDSGYWEQILTKNEQREAMRLCFGHAGVTRMCIVTCPVFMQPSVDKFYFKNELKYAARLNNVTGLL